MAYSTISDLQRYFENTPEEYSFAMEKLTAEQKRNLPDDCFGLPEKRKYPLIVKGDGNDWTHLKNAIAYFNTCKDEEDKKILAENIARVIRENNVQVKISPNAKIRNYADFEGL